MTECSSKKEAIAAGAPRYFTGKPCKHGHLCERFVDGHCIECAHKTRRAWELDNLEARKKYFRQWKLENPEKGLASYKRWSDKHRNAWMRAWRQKNIEHVRLYSRTLNHKRRELIRQSPSYFTEDDVRRILNAQRNRCAYCRQKMQKYTIDHIIPITRGGSNEACNIQMTCALCNNKKKAKDPIKFAQQVGMLI